MPRHMSFALTTKQFADRTKTVTRRFGWWFLKAGDIVIGVKKGMGLKKGEKVEKVGSVRIVSSRPEILSAITPGDVTREGFPGWTPEQYVRLMVDKHKCKPDAVCNRIEFEHIKDEGDCS